jgi:hypothetical protein
MARLVPKIEKYVILCLRLIVSLVLLWLISEGIGRLCVVVNVLSRVRQRRTRRRRCAAAAVRNLEAALAQQPFSQIVSQLPNIVEVSSWFLSMRGSHSWNKFLCLQIFISQFNGNKNIISFLLAADLFSVHLQICG